IAARVSTSRNVAVVRATRSTPGSRRRTRRRYLVVAAFMSPWIVGFFALYVYPMLASLYYSFTKYDGGKSAPRWVGLFNYRFMFTQDPLFWASLRNTICMAPVSAPLSILLSP